MSCTVKKKSRKQRRAEARQNIESSFKPKFYCYTDYYSENILYGLIQIGKYEAKTYLPQLLDDAITRGHYYNLDPHIYEMYSRMDPEDWLNLIDICIMWDQIEEIKQNMRSQMLNKYERNDL